MESRISVAKPSFKTWPKGKLSAHAILEAVFTTTVDCGLTERPAMPMPLSGVPDRGEGNGRPDLAPDCDRDRLLVW